MRADPTANRLSEPIATVNHLAYYDRDIDSHVCCEALAAAEIVAASRNQPAAGLPADLKRLADSLQLTNYSNYQDLVLLTRRAVGVIVEESELQELWAKDTEDLAAWEQIQKDLQQHLQWQVAYDTAQP